MTSKFSIAILGIGGVGGYLGAKLAVKYSNPDEVEIIFIARGENEKAIQANGLRLISGTGEKTVHPSVVTKDPGSLGLVNLVLVAVKAYDLESSLELIRPCVNDQTILLPFLNGVDAPERIQKIFPSSEVWEGCIYIVTRLIAPGIIRESGNVNSLYFGSSTSSGEMIQRVEKLFIEAGINAHVSGNILQTVWEKFVFISPLATITSYHDCVAGEILNDENRARMLLQLVKEVKAVSDACGVGFPETIIQKTWNKIISLRNETSTSMRDDFRKGGKVELDSLTAYVVRLGKKYGIPVPRYEELLSGLEDKLAAKNF